MLKQTLKILLKITILTFLILYIFNYASKANYFQVKNINITGNNFLEDKAIYKIIENEINDDVVRLDLKMIQKKINKNEYISSSKIFTLFPSYLYIEINEIIPVGIYENNNKRYLLDLNSKSIEASNKSLNFFNVPIINNLSKYSDKNKISNLLKNILANNESLYLSINEIKLNDEKINILLNSNTNITLNKDNHKYDLRVLLKFIDSIQDFKKISNYKYIDLSIKNQIIVKEII